MVDRRRMGLPVHLEPEECQAPDWKENGGGLVWRLVACATHPHGLGLAVSALLSAGLLTCVPITTANAAQARAILKVGLRIDARLLERDLARKKGTVMSATSAPGGRRSAASGSTIRRKTLPRADGSGICRKVYVTRVRFRWRCR